ncbi:MAG: STAS/SEC14 domain-containing protein [Oceanospirillaceae bacterium]|nr:STAS/SEC14 domain-containing protein [Oceanospirillaceae bacterium]
MFVGHGSNQVSIQDNIITITLIGSFNEYDFKDIAQKVKQAVAEYNGKQFCILVNDVQLFGATPEAYEELEKLNQWLNTQPMIAKAIVISPSSLLDTIKTRVPAIRDQNVKTFEIEEDAICWLKSF